MSNLSKHLLRKLRSWHQQIQLNILKFRFNLRQRVLEVIVNSTFTGANAVISKNRQDSFQQKYICNCS